MLFISLIFCLKKEKLLLKKLFREIIFKTNFFLKFIYFIFKIEFRKSRLKLKKLIVLKIPLIQFM